MQYANGREFSFHRWMGLEEKRKIKNFIGRYLTVKGKCGEKRQKQRHFEYHRLRE